MRDNENETARNETGLRSDALKHIQIFNDEGLTYGIPSKYFWFGIVVSLAITVLLKWYIGPIFAIVYLVSMYEIHRDDPKALEAWMDAAVNKRKETWVTGLHKDRKFKIIDKE